MTGKVGMGSGVGVKAGAAAIAFACAFGTGGRQCAIRADRGYHRGRRKGAPVA